MVLTETKHLVFFEKPRTSVTLYEKSGAVKGSHASIRYNTSDPRRLEELHAAIVQAVADIGLPSFTDSTRTGTHPLNKKSQHLLRFVKKVS